MDEIEIGEVVVAEEEDLKAAAGEDRSRGHGAKQNVRAFHNEFSDLSDDVQAGVCSMKIPASNVLYIS